MTYGEQLVGLSFNVGNREDVHECKKRFAESIDQLKELIAGPEKISEMQYLLAQEAIKRALDAQMWAVKALTAE